jgi:hypothetical protein
MLRTMVIVMFFLGIILFPPSSLAKDHSSRTETQSTHVVRSAVIGSSGVPISGGGYTIKSTLGQPQPLGIIAESGNTHQAGFWPTWLRTYWTAIEDEPPVFTNKLFQNYPNPFNPTTTIEYTVAAPSVVDLKIYNVLGQRVRHLVNDIKQPGRYKAIWNGKSERGDPVASGVYFYRLRIGGFTDVKKMVVLK